VPTPPASISVLFPPYSKLSSLRPSLIPTHSLLLSRLIATATEYLQHLPPSWTFDQGAAFLGAFFGVFPAVFCHRVHADFTELSAGLSSDLCACDCLYSFPYLAVRSAGADSMVRTDRIGQRESRKHRPRALCCRSSLLLSLSLSLSRSACENIGIPQQAQEE
jgi:hypothetical protein